MAAHPFIFGAGPNAGGSGGGGSIAVAVSDATPDVGQSITITATPTGFTPTDYYFYAKQGSTLINIGSSVSGVINWTVTLVGAIDIFAQAHDNTASAFNIGGETITSQIVVIVTNLQLYLDPFRSNIVAPSYHDISGLGRNGTLVNTPTVVVGSLAANNGGYIELNGVNQYIDSIGTVADFAFVQNTRVFSMGGFFYINSTSTYVPLIASSITSSKKGFVLSLRGDQSKEIQVALTDGSGITGNIIFFYSLSNAITSIGWYHIYATYTGVGGVAQIYLNGSPIATTVTGTAAPPTGNSTNPLRIGSETLNVYFMNGRIGPVQIYNAALTAGQVLTNFNVDRSRYGL